MSGGGAYAYVSFSVPMRPTPKERPRVGQGRAWTPKRTRDAEEAVRAASKAVRPIPAGAPFSAEVLSVYARPPGHLKKDGSLSALGLRHPYPRGADVDNLAKLVLDSLQGHLFDDDALCVRLITSKEYGAADRVDVRLFWK